jgi:hypothetical protein
MARGRPQIGVTRKLSLTLPENEWVDLDKIAEREGLSTSGILREVVGFYLWEVVEKKRAVTEGRSGAEDRARQGDRASAR